MLSINLINEEIIEESEQFEREASGLDEPTPLNKKHSSFLRDQEVESEAVRIKYKIDAMDIENVDIAEYRIVEIVNEDAMDPESKAIGVKEVISFRGPALMSQANNFGLYVSEDLKLVTFYYKDVFKNL